MSSGYLAPYGLTYDQRLTRLSFDLPAPESGVQSGSALGELTADAYLWAAEHLAGVEPGTPTVAVTADGVLRAPLYAGELTTSMAFDVLSMGVGEAGSAGFPLVSCYLTGKELRAVAEVDASVTPLMPAAQLYTAGMSYSFNTHRVPFNRVTGVWLTGEKTAAQAEKHTETETWKNELENDRLYLANIKTDSHMRGHTQEEMNAMMEQYLGARFQKNIPVGDSTGLDLRFGLMPADWLDGSIFVRQKFNEPEEPGNRQKHFQEWENAPFQELIFKKGQLQQVVNRQNTKDRKSVIDPALLKR